MLSHKLHLLSVMYLVCRALSEETNAVKTSFGSFNKMAVRADGTHKRIREARQTLAPPNLSGDQVGDCVDEHNGHRVGEGASNMMYMQWSDALASMAQLWADQCQWKHGQVNVSYSPNTSVGQNLAITWPQPPEAGVDVVAAIGRWYDEKKHYDYDTLTCDDGQMCGHYTQVVWADSWELGCGYKYCPTVTNPRGDDFTDGHLFVCNYGPSGNYKDRPPFLKGQPCTGCTSGVFTCHQDMCREDCGDDAGCTCGASCQNCGSVTKDCRCQCVSGYMGNDCADTCGDIEPECGKEWTPSYCQFDSYLKKCPLMCEMCDIQDACPSGSARPVLTMAVRLCAAVILWDVLIDRNHAH